MDLQEHLFRHEAGRLVSILARLFGIHNLALAEDVVQDAFCRALETWKFHGVPANPSAWLMKTAKNRALDLLRFFDQQLRQIERVVAIVVPTVAELRPLLEQVGVVGIGGDDAEDARGRVEHDGEPVDRERVCAYPIEECQVGVIIDRSGGRDGELRLAAAGRAAGGRRDLHRTRGGHGGRSRLRPQLELHGGARLKIASHCASSVARRCGCIQTRGPGW